MPPCLPGFAFPRSSPTIPETDLPPRTRRRSLMTTSLPSAGSKAMPGPIVHDTEVFRADFQAIKCAASATMSAACRRADPVIVPRICGVCLPRTRLPAKALEDVRRVPLPLGDISAKCCYWGSSSKPGDFSVHFHDARPRECQLSV